MIHAEYSDGRKYHAATLDVVNLAEFTVHGLSALRVASFVWHIEEHGSPLYHGMRTCKNGDNAVMWRIYILVTDRYKIFVFSQGDTRILTEWIPGDKFFDQFGPNPLPLPIAGGETIARS